MPYFFGSLKVAITLAFVGSVVSETVASNYGRGLARLGLGDEGGREDLARARALDIDVAEDFAVFEARHPRLTE